MAQPDMATARARTQLRSALKLGRRWQDRASRWFALPENRQSLLAIGAITVVLQAGVLAAYTLEPTFAAGNTPVDPAMAFGTLWQVQAALVAVALPLLLLLVELSRTSEVTARRSAEVLVRDTWIFPTLLYATLGVVRIGFDSLWFDSDSSLLIDFWTILVPTAGLAAFGYWRAGRLLFNPQRMQKRSRDLLFERLDASIDDLAVTRQANACVIEVLHECEAAHTFYFAPTYAGGRWAVLTSRAGGRIVDINLRALASLLQTLPRRDVATEEPEVVEAPSVPRNPIQLVRLVGDFVTNGDPLMLISTDAYAVDQQQVDRFEHELNRALKVLSP